MSNSYALHWKNYVSFSLPFIKSFLNIKTLNKAQIWSKEKEALLRYIQSKLRDSFDAEDLLQDVYLKFESSKNIAQPKSWLYKVARFTIADFYRESEKRKEIIFSEKQNLSSDNCVCDLASFVISQYLPEKYARPLLLSDIEQIPQKNIAETLGLSLTATKSRIQRARIKLKELTENCIDLTYNSKGQISSFELKRNCELPPELLEQIEKLKISI